MTDLAGTSNFLLVAVVGLLTSGTFTRRRVVLTALISIWAIRLGFFLFFRVLLRRKDARFDRMRESPLRLAAFWVLQTAWVWITSLPLILIHMPRFRDLPVDWVDQVGWIFWAIGFFLESVADVQRHRFNMARTERGRPFLDTGLWRYSRHPNYFGEILLWSGIWLSAANGLIPMAPGQAVLALASPLLTFILLVYVSGIPLAEARDDRANHQLMAYKQYKFTTSVLLPMPPSWYAALPHWAKKYIFLDRYQLAFITGTPSRSAVRRTSPRNL